MSIVATGGTITYANGRKIHTFTSDGTFTVALGGDVEILMVAGGASGGIGLTPPYFGGGGGAGGVIYDAALTLAQSTISITIGQGGAAKSSLSNTKGNNGTDTILDDGSVLIGVMTAVGGGAGGGFGAGTEPNTGGSGGGGVYNAGGAAGTAGQGYKGGDGGGFAQGPAGGGGAGGAGGNYSTGDGGIGVEHSISGTALYYAGGGAGAGGSVSTGVGGLGGGGDWGEAASYYGGGGSGNYTGGTVSYAGYQGIVIISYDFSTADRRRAQNEDLANMPAATIKGRMTSSGIPQDLTASQVGSILVNGLTADTLVDADEFSFWKAATSVMKKITWANIKATIKTYTDTLYVAKNANITAATKTKITYDVKGLVTAGADATTADIADSTNKRYVTDADLVDIGNLSGTNTGDQDLSGLQPLDADLTAIAGLAPANDDVIQRKAGAWVNRTIAQLTTDIRTVIDSVYVALTGNQTVAGIKTFSAAPTIAPTSPTDGTDFLLFTLERAWRMQQALTGGSSMLEFFSDTAGKYVRINPNAAAAGGLYIGQYTSAVPEMSHVIGSGNIKAAVESILNTGYAFNRLRNNTPANFDFGLYGSAHGSTLYGISTNSLATVSTAAGALVVGTSGASSLHLGTNATSRVEIDSSGNIYLGGGTTNAVKIATGGELSLLGTATVWDDLRIEPTSRSSGAKAPTFANWKGGLYLYDFDNAALASEKEIFFTVQLPHGWKEGSAVEPHVHWVNKATGTAGHVVRWGLEYTKSVIGGTFGASTTVYGTTIAGGGDITVADEHMLTDFASIDMTGDTISTVLVCRLFRNSSNAADTYTGTAGLLYIDWHVELDSMGSKTELAK
jgi:hypothetical protein